MNLASAHRELGEIKEADLIIAEGFKRNFKHLSYFTGYVMNKKNELSNKHINHYTDKLNTQINSDDKVLICHAFYNYFKSKNDTKNAGTFLVRGNKLQYGMKEFEINKDIILFSYMLSIF